MPKNKISGLKKIISSKALSFLLILVLIFALVSLGREINRRLTLRKELSNLENQIKTLETENQELLDDLAEMKTEYFKEKAARLKFGLMKPGEQVIVVVPEDNNSVESRSIAEYFGKKISNFKTWWNYFFK